MVFEGLIRALDGRKSLFPAMDIWQWDMPGSGGSQWNITTSTNPSPRSAEQRAAGRLVVGLRQDRRAGAVDPRLGRAGIRRSGDD